MTATADTRNCQTCGATFKRSRADTTRNCPEHRGRATAKAKAKSYAEIACGRCGHLHTTLRCDRCGF